MTFPTVFANLASGNQPASLLDTMFNICGGMGNIPCTAAGTNAITLTPVTNFYQPAAYANYQTVIFRAAATSTGAVTVQLGGLAPVKLFMANGVQANAGDIALGTKYQAFFASDLDGGNGGFIVNNSTVPAATPAIASSLKNLTVINGGNPDTQVAVTADEVIVENNVGGTARLSTINLTIGTGVSGVNGLDTGAIAQATWYSVWVIYNAGSSTTAGLISLSTTTPTLPAGYAYKARVGWVRTGAASTNLHRIRQLGRRAQYVVTSASQTLNMPLITNGINGTVGTTFSPTWAPFNLNTFVPPTASEVVLYVTNNYNNNALSSVQVAPSTAYSGSVTTNPPPMNLGAGSLQNAFFSMIIESTFQIFYTANAAGGGLFCSGWIDNI